MAKQNLIIRDFSGGIGTLGEKKDIPNSVRFSKNLNPFEDTSYITLARKTTKVSGSTVTTLPTWMEDGSPWSTNRYFYDEGGKIYQETSGGAWSSLRTVSGGAGEGLKVFDDYLYYALGVSLGRYGKLSGTPAFNDDFLTDGTTNVDTSGGGTGQTYSTATSIAETATHRQTFTPERDSLKSIIIDINDTGDDPTWTVTVHDSNNTLIGAKTTAFASVTTGDNTFTFATPLRLVINNSYHFHVTTSTTTGAPKVTTNVASDLEGAEFSTIYGILIDTQFHPMESFLDFLVIGNERYLAKWDQATYNPNFVTFAPGFECRALAKFDEFIVAACFKGSSIQEAEEARLYFWDGIQATFNFFNDLKIGAANAITNSNGELIGIYGSDGSMYKNNDPFQEVADKVPKLARGKKVEVYPGAMTNFEGSTLVGISAVTDDSAGLEQGVYEYNSQQSQLMKVLNFPFTISTGTTQGTTLKIGFIKSIGTDLYIGWQDGA